MIATLASLVVFAVFVAPEPTPTAASADVQHSPGERNGTVKPGTLLDWVESMPKCSIVIPAVKPPLRFRNRVLLSVQLDPQGKVGEIQVLKSTGIKRVDDQVVGCLKGWRFKKTSQATHLTATVIIEIL